MIYAEPRYMRGGDQFFIMEIGNDMSLRSNCYVLELGRATKMANLKGVNNVVPTWRSLMIQYDQFEISYHDLKKEMGKIKNIVKNISKISSRIIHVPIIYGGKWGPDFSATAEYNDVSEKEAKKLHYSELQWVGLVGFVPGHPFIRPLKTGKKLHGKIYDSPRTYTPEGTVGLGGITTTVYTVAIPGGYAMIGYVPTPLYDPFQLLPDFQKTVILLRPGDRIKFVPCEIDEFDLIRQKARERIYKFTIDEGIFNLDEWEKKEKNNNEKSMQPHKK